MTPDTCAVHGVVEAGLNKIILTQELQAKSQAKMYTSIAVIESTLVNLQETKALNCGARIEALEKASDGCRVLRAGPRMDKVESRQDRLLWGAVGVIALNILGLIFAYIKGAFK